MEIKTARAEDIGAYVAQGKAAQAWLQSRGLGQYVPAAHDAYLDAIRSRVASGTLYVVWGDDAAVGFFSLEASPSPWWGADDEPALYLGGIVVASGARGQGIGASILHWCAQEARRRGCRFLRLDCHASNRWLCDYYEAHGFTLRGQVEQAAGYDGCLYECAVTPRRQVREC